MISEYMRAALGHAEYKWLPEDQIFYAEIPELPGLWASGDTREAAEADLRESLEGWIALRLQRGRPVPTIDGISLAFELTA